MECKTCSSVNIEKLSHYWQSLPAESPLRGRYAPPQAGDGRLWLPVLAVIVGIAFAVSGGVVLGLLVALGGAAWGAVMHQGQVEYETALAQWNRALICLVCEERF